MFGGDMMKKYIFFPLIAIMLLGVGCQQKQQSEAPGTQTPGAGLQTQQEISMLQDVLRKDPGNVKAWINLGNDQMDSGRFDEAIAAYQKAIDIDPKNVDVRVDMGTCYRRIGKPDIAVKEYREALKINPNHQMALRNLGIVLEYDLKDNKGAIEAFEKYLQTAPNAQDAEQTKQEIARMKAEKQQ
jgi:cytochrome c-type biogenesis protein CcmH/NrfG